MYFHLAILRSVESTSETTEGCGLLNLPTSDLKPPAFFDQEGRIQIFNRDVDIFWFDEQVIELLLGVV